ncbi:hypothetical protein [Spirosoma sp. KNUC1025]|uniref:hypothetical protein n=1 Tax=Spirosoma sp. KNUC1025 TaxID=2894082 RepID=UPI003863C5F9|nr:hypothetical protein LN737_22305 [Spirosoma sp. KNUC1025]
MSYSQQRVPTRVVESDTIRTLKKGVWLYFILLIFEGALRKWFLPGLSTPLLVIRDPVAIWLLFTAWRADLLPSTSYIAISVGIGLFGIFTALALGHGNLFVALYGARILLFHFPLMFLIGRVFNRDDVIQLGRITLWIAIPMTVLIALQFYSPQSAWVNRGVGGDMEGAGFSGALGYYRPPGTFSFTNGTTLFYGFASSFVVYFWLYPKGLNRIILIGATAGLLAAIPLSISRGLFFQVALALVFAVATVFNDPKYLGQILVSSIIILIAFTLLSYTSFFQTATKAFFTRFDVANKNEGGVEGVLIDRYLGGLVGSLKSSAQQPFFGYGIGTGTNVGSVFLAGKEGLSLGEGEWGRLIGELGPLLGLIIVFMRLKLSASIVMASIRRLKAGDLLPWMLLSFGLLIVPQGGWAQPTSLGFSIITGGVMLASFRSPPKPRGRS